MQVQPFSQPIADNGLNNIILQFTRPQSSNKWVLAGRSVGRALHFACRSLPSSLPADKNLIESSSFIYTFMITDWENEWYVRHTQCPLLLAMMITTSATLDEWHDWKWTAGRFSLCCKISKLNADWRINYRKQRLDLGHLIMFLLLWSDPLSPFVW